MRLFLFTLKNKITKILFVLGITVLIRANKFYRLLPSSYSKTIVLLSLHKLGDTIFSFPTLKYFHNKFGNNLKIICLKSAEDLYSLIGTNINLIPIPDQYFYLKGRIAGYRARKILKKLHPEMIIDITGEINSVSLFLLRNIRYIYGRCTIILKPLYDRYLIKEERPSLPDRIFDIVQLFSMHECIKDYKEQPIITTKVKKILIHPHAGWKAKEWNFNKFVTLAEYLSKNYLCRIVFEKNPFPKDLKEYLLDKNVNFIITHTLNDLIIAIKDCDLFIGNDSGPANIASFLGKKTFIIYGPVNPSYCFTYAENRSYILKKLKCMPKGDEHYCFTNAGRDGCPSFECMNQLTIDEVLKGVFQLL